ncbi:MAG: helix-turn-helix domain-containing protein [Actinomycetota bacterium]|nr:helix-turn-helix domain-containing protein [Actinomycetota bacterium]
MSDAADDRLLSVGDVARLLSVTEPTIRVWIKDGKLRAQRAGARFWRIRQSEVDRMLSEQAASQSLPSSGARPLTAPQARDLLSSLITNPEQGRDIGR